MDSIDIIRKALCQLNSQIGNLTELDTENKTNIVEAINELSGRHALLIQSESDTTVSGFSVPALTAEQVQQAYNAVVAGLGCIIIDHDDIGHFYVNQADALNGEIAIEILFYNTMLVTYTVVDDDVEVVGSQIGGGGGLEQYATLADFPATGNVAISYLAKDTKGLYYWDAATSTYITMANKLYPVPGPDTANGIYIKYTDGTISPYDTLVEGKTPVGVALINNDENVKLVMHPKVSVALWQTPNGTITGAFNSDSKHNTDLILAARNTYSVPAAIWAREGAIWADGSEGQLPSMDVMEMFLANATQVNVAMGLIGGSTIQRSSNYWSSNQNNSSQAWYWLASNQSWRSGDKSASSSVRSVCAF